jgi:hypothetical protein
VTHHEPFPAPLVAPTLSLLTVRAPSYAQLYVWAVKYIVFCRVRPRECAHTAIDDARCSTASKSPLDVDGGVLLGARVYSHLPHVYTQIPQQQRQHESGGQESMMMRMPLSVERGTWPCSRDRRDGGALHAPFLPPLLEVPVAGC